MIIGRFAPSPTGPLHAGSLVAALGSYLQTKHRGGLWRLRIDDIDPPRAVPGSVSAIELSLKAHGLFPDGELERQSRNSVAYESALAALERQGVLFRCQCTRSTLGSDGTCVRDCAQQHFDPGLATSLRVTVPQSTEISFTDLIQGDQAYLLGKELRNFIVKRRDGLYAYQLAAAVDDIPPHITEVIRGGDLLSSTPRQLLLQQLLALPSPQYGHLPVVTNAMGEKLSKQAGAEALDDSSPLSNLRTALAVLGQEQPPPRLGEVPALVSWAIKSWKVQRVPR